MDQLMGAGEDGWMDKWVEKIKVWAVGLSKSLFSSCFHDFDQVFFAIFIGDDLVSNDQTRSSRCELFCLHSFEDESKVHRRNIHLRVCVLICVLRRRMSTASIRDISMLFCLFNASTSQSLSRSKQIHISPPL